MNQKSKRIGYNVQTDNQLDFILVEQQVWNALLDWIGTRAGWANQLSLLHHQLCRGKKQINGDIQAGKVAQTNSYLKKNSMKILKEGLVLVCVGRHRRRDLNLNLVATGDQMCAANTALGNVHLLLLEPGLPS